ncbi:MAG: glycosyltransferase family 4 protein [Actinomycetota bacterium]
MKVGIVCPYDWSFPGGVRSHILGLADALRNCGIEVEIIAPATHAEPEIFVAGRTVGIPYNGSVARLCFSPGAARRLKQRLGRGDLDLLHLHEPASPSVSLLALLQAQMPVVATFHASAERSVAYRFARPALCRPMNRIGRKIAVSEAARRLVSTYFPGDYTMIPNGIVKERFGSAVPLESLLGLKPMVVFVGRPEPRKGLPVVVEAVEILRRERTINLVVVGPGPGNVPGWVRALGPVGEKELPRVLASADVFCAPSLGGESFGIVLVEAMAAGLPVVCSDIEGYVAAAAGAALHAPAGDPQATARAIDSVLCDPIRAASLVASGKIRAAELDWSTLVGRVVDCYRAAGGQP